MSEDDFDDFSARNLKINKEEDYLRQVIEIEEQEQDYINKEKPLVKDISSILHKKQPNIKGGSRAKRSLMLDLKNVSIFRLYFHLSETFEIILMIIGFLGSVATGASNPIMAYLTGSTTSVASSSAANKIEDLNDEEKKKEYFAFFKEQMDKKVRDFLIYGAASFVAAFISNFLW